MLPSPVGSVLRTPLPLLHQHLYQTVCCHLVGGAGGRGRRGRTKGRGAGGRGGGKEEGGRGGGDGEMEEQRSNSMLGVEIPFFTDTVEPLRIQPPEMMPTPVLRGWTNLPSLLV